MGAATLYSEEPQRTPGSILVVLAAADPDRREAIARMLRGEGYELVALETGAQLLQYLYNSLAQQTRPDLVICDAELEGIDGAQVCIISRAQDELLPFIVVARDGVAGDFDSLELADDACVVCADVDLDELKANVVRLAGDP
jgi:CheY-like chemotaxis protein